MKVLLALISILCGHSAKSQSISCPPLNGEFFVNLSQSGCGESYQCSLTCTRKSTTSTEATPEATLPPAPTRPGRPTRPSLPTRPVTIPSPIPTRPSQPTRPSVPTKPTRIPPIPSRPNRPTRPSRPSKPTQEPATTPTTAPPLSDEELIAAMCESRPEENFFYSHPSRCAQYISCRNGLWEIRDCEPGKHFSLEFGACVDSWMSDCEEV